MSAETEVYPWETPPELLAKAAAYDEQGNYRSFLCKCSEFLNTLLKYEASRGLVHKAELRVYPDLVGVDARLGCLASLMTKKWEPMGFVLSLVLYPIALFLMLAAGLLAAGPIGILMVPVVLGLAVLVVGAALAAVVFFWYIAIPGILLLFGISVALAYLAQQRLAYIVRRIREDPKSPYAVRKLYKYSVLFPRFWRRGDVVQIIRVDAGRALFRRALILVVQDNALPARAGCLAMGVGVHLGRLLRAERRIYALSINRGQAEADAAAAAMASVLGVPVAQAAFGVASLRLV